MEAVATRVRCPPGVRRRVCAEYQEVPGLRLTLAQAARLWDLDVDTCREVLDQLVDEAFLRCEDGLYMRADCDSGLR